MDELGKIGDIASTELMLATLDRLVEGKVVARRAVNAIRKLIEDSKAYDERIDKIVEHYSQQDSEGEQVWGKNGKMHKFIKEIQANPYVGEQVDEELTLWIDRTLKGWETQTRADIRASLQEAYMADIGYLKRIKQLLSQKRVVTREWIKKWTSNFKPWFYTDVSDKIEIILCDMCKDLNIKVTK